MGLRAGLVWYYNGMGFMVWYEWCGGIAVTVEWPPAAKHSSTTAFQCVNLGAYAVW